MTTYLERLHKVVSAAAPIRGIRSNRTVASTIPDYDPVATTAQRAAAQAAIAAFDFTDASETAARADMATFVDNSIAALAEITADDAENDTAITRLAGGTLNAAQLQGELRNTNQRLRRLYARERRMHRAVLRNSADRLV